MTDRRRAPLWALAGFYFVAWVILDTFLYGDFVAATAKGLLFATLMALFIAWQRRRDAAAEPPTTRE